jgi:hypothetical protein
MCPKCDKMKTYLKYSEQVEALAAETVRT